MAHLPGDGCFPPQERIHVLFLRQYPVSVSQVRHEGPPMVMESGLLGMTARVLRRRWTVEVTSVVLYRLFYAAYFLLTLCRSGRSFEFCGHRKNEYSLR